jgi:lantibiotic biosynthesis protein
MNKNIYLPAPFFLFRSPIWATEEFEKILTETNWIEAVLDLYERSPYLREAICIASPDLFRSLNQKPIKDKEYSANSLLNYISRMCTRAVPFGLFSFVTLGAWHERSQASLDVSQIKKRARPDMEWLCSYLQGLYSDEAQLPKLSVRTNPLIEFKGGRLNLRYIRNLQKKKEQASSYSIKSNRLVSLILMGARESVSLESLWQNIQAEQPGLDYQKTFQVIKQLIDQQYLLPGGLPSLLTQSPFEDVRRQIPQSNQLDSMNEALSNYSRLPLGEGNEALEELQSQMEKLAKAKTLVQVDLAIEGRNIALSKQILLEVEGALSFLWSVSPTHHQPPSLKKYQEKFIGRYGTDRIIPLLDLLSEEKGLGLLEKGIDKDEGIETKFSTRWQSWLTNEWQRCLRDNRDEIVVDAHLVETLFATLQEPMPKCEEAALSLDVYCKVIANSTKEIDNGEFLISISQIGDQCGATFGRFVDVLGGNVLEDLKALHQQEEQLEPEVKFFEVSYLPAMARGANVAIQPQIRSLRLDLEGKKQGEGTLSLDELYVGATANRLYLTNKTGKNEYVGCAGNLLNHNLAPAPIQFIREVMHCRNRFIHPFSLDKFIKKAVYLPRVRMGKTILSPAQWNLDGKAWAHEKLAKISELFKSWAEEWHLPVRFLLVFGDMHLMLDRHHPAHLLTIAQKIKKGESLNFFEVPHTAWSRSARGHHHSEIVIPFVKNPAYINHKNRIKPVSHLPVTFDNRWKLPGSPWIYLKLYIGPEGTDRFIVENLSELIAHLENRFGSVDWFFVRYSDPDKHLRLRLCFSSAEEAAQAILMLQGFTAHWMETGLIRDLLIAGYEREVERYGGLDLLSAAEKLFVADSRGVARLLRAQVSKQFVNHTTLIHTLSVLSFLRGFHSDIEQMLKTLGERDLKGEELKGFREHKSALISLAQEVLGFTDTSVSNDAKILLHSTEERAAAVSHFSHTVATSGHLSNEQQVEIFNSLLHMHCNRIGMDQKAEIRARLFAKNVLSQVLHLKSREPITKYLTKGV